MLDGLGLSFDELHTVESESCMQAAWDAIAQEPSNDELIKLQISSKSKEQKAHHDLKKVAEL